MVDAEAFGDLAVADIIADQPTRLRCLLGGELRFAAEPDLALLGFADTVGRPFQDAGALLLVDRREQAEHGPPGRGGERLDFPMPYTFARSQELFLRAQRKL